MVWSQLFRQIISTAHSFCASMGQVRVFRVCSVVLFHTQAHVGDQFDDDACISSSPPSSVLANVYHSEFEHR